jgi:hypothetical protein
MSVSAEDYRYSRAAARSHLFSWLARGPMPYGASKRFSRAWRLLSAGDKTTLRRHQHRSVTDWTAEEAAVDRLRDALRLTDDTYRQRIAA